MIFSKLLFKPPLYLIHIIRDIIEWILINKNIKFYCSYEYLEKLRINLFYQANNIKDGISIFNDIFNQNARYLK